MKQNYKKKYYNTSEQLKHLKSKGLLFNDTQHAQDTLSYISYYRLSGYLHHFRCKDKNNRFFENIYFEDVVELYKFDAKLRLLIMGALESIEVSLRTAIIQSMAIDNPFICNAQDIFTFKDDSYAKFQTGRLKNWQQSQETFKKHFDNTYKLPPLWVEIETWTMGTIRNFIDALEEKYKIKIVKNRYFKTPNHLVGWTKNLTTLRNICAHHGRLWNKNLNHIQASNKGLGDLHILFNNTLNIQKNDINKNPNNRVYYYCMIMWYILKNVVPESNWNTRLSKHINTLPRMSHVGLKNMGFPENWETEPFWKL